MVLYSVNIDNASLRHFLTNLIHYFHFMFLYFYTFILVVFHMTFSYNLYGCIDLFQVDLT